MTKRKHLEVVGDDKDLRDHMVDESIVSSVLICVVCVTEHSESSTDAADNAKEFHRNGWRVCNITTDGEEEATEGPCCPRCIKKYRGER